ncbi:hypothetical protein H5410_059897 [Solanum commersonii]|uniref:Uncharacterized protein n=1 Tax=Solanum commersonii TaxID=4109 RepID=A0A9J5W3M4_SOLCO|nr:hypothetical protein H5410_059897 [Solanum commersonii]
MDIQGQLRRNKTNNRKRQLHQLRPANLFAAVTSSSCHLPPHPPFHYFPFSTPPTAPCEPPEMASPLHPLGILANSLVASYSGGKGTNIASHSSEKEQAPPLSLSHHYEPASTTMKPTPLAPSTDNRHET